MARITRVFDCDADPNSGVGEFGRQLSRAMDTQYERVLREENISEEDFSLRTLGYCNPIKQVFVVVSYRPNADFADLTTREIEAIIALKEAEIRCLNVELDKLDEDEVKEEFESKDSEECRIAVEECIRQQMEIKIKKFELKSDIKMLEAKIK